MKNPEPRQFLLNWLLTFGAGEATSAEVVACGWYWAGTSSCWSARPYIRERASRGLRERSYSITQAGLDFLKGTEDAGTAGGGTEDAATPLNFN